MEEAVRTSFVPCTEVWTILTLEPLDRLFPSKVNLKKKRIDQIQVGDYVLSLDYVKGVFSGLQVLKIHQRPVDKLMRVQSDMGKVHCHPDQWFMMGNGVWTQARRLQEGYVLKGWNSSHYLHERRIESIHLLTEAEVRTYNTGPDDLMTYDLEIEGDGSFLTNNFIAQGHQSDETTFRLIEKKGETIVNSREVQAVITKLKRRLYAKDAKVIEDLLYLARHVWDANNEAVNKLNDLIGSFGVERCTAAVRLVVDVDHTLEQAIPFVAQLMDAGWRVEQEKFRGDGWSTRISIPCDREEVVNLARKPPGK